MTVPEGGGKRPGRTGIVLRDALPWPEARQIVETAEETGYEAVFVPEIEGREAFSTLTGFAAASERLQLGTGVVTVRARRPVTTAMAAATVHDISGGRMVLGIGAGAPDAGPASVPLPPVRLTEAYVHVVRQVLAGRPVEGDEVFGTNGFRLGLPTPDGPPPIWLAALGDRMMALAGRSADGVLLNWCTPERVATARRTLAEAAERAGRDPAHITVAVYVRACLGVEEDVALGAMRGMTGLYASIPHYLAQLEALGLGEEGRAAAAAHAAGRPEDVPASLVRALTVTGGRSEALARFDAYRDAGADLILCYPVAALEPFSSVLGTVLAAAPTSAVER